MTKRLYYTEPYLSQFGAQVVEGLTWDGHPALVLDRTAFYPTSGGQPADRGMLDDVDVLDVVEREEDAAIVHVLSEPVSGSEVQGQVNWARRFDHMQQHTGQHVLSAAFERELDADTVGFHLGSETSTIDLDIAGLEVGDVVPVETVANKVVWDDRPVIVRFVDLDKLAELSVERPPDVEGPIRLVEIPAFSEDRDPRFDVNPCGGTHVARTGEIGMIKVLDLEHRGDHTRIEFVCGKRALLDYQAKDRLTARLARRLTVGYWELDESIQRLQEENTQLRRTERELRQRLLDAESAQLVATAAAHGPYRVVSEVWQQRPPDELRSLARKLAEHPDLVALLFSVDGRTHFCFARAENMDLDVNELLQEACAQLDGKGGGRPQVAQGSAPPAGLRRVTDLLQDLQVRLERW